MAFQDDVLDGFIANADTAPIRLVVQVDGFSVVGMVTTSDAYRTAFELPSVGFNEAFLHLREADFPGQNGKGWYRCRRDAITSYFVFNAEIQRGQRAKEQPSPITP